MICLLSCLKARCSSSCGAYPLAIKPPSRARKGRSSARARCKRSSRCVSSFDRDKWFEIEERADTLFLWLNKRPRISSAAFNPSLMALRSRGLPRPTVRRDRDRSVSGTVFKISRKHSRISVCDNRHSTSDKRSLMVSISVEGLARRAESRRPPAAVTVLSIVAKREPLRSPFSVCVISRLRRVAASISIVVPLMTDCRGRIWGREPFCVRPA